MHRRLVLCPEPLRLQPAPARECGIMVRASSDGAAPAPPQQLPADSSLELGLVDELLLVLPGAHHFGEGIGHFTRGVVSQETVRASVLLFTLLASLLLCPPVLKQNSSRGLLPCYNSKGIQMSFLLKKTLTRRMFF